MCPMKSPKNPERVQQIMTKAHSQRGFDFKVLFQIEPPIFIVEFHSKL